MYLYIALPNILMSSCVADQQETDIPHIETVIRLYDSFSEVMENIESMVLSNIQLDQAIKSEPV